MSLLYEKHTFAALRKYAHSNSNDRIDLKIAFIGDWSMQFLAEALKGCAILGGKNVVVDCYFNDDVLVEILSSEQIISDKSYDYIALSLSAEKLYERFCNYNKRMCDEETDKINTAVIQLKKICKNIILFNIIEKHDGISNSDSFLNQCKKVNVNIAELANTAGVLYFDINSILCVLGLLNTLDSKMYYNCKCPIKFDAIAEIARDLWNLIETNEGKQIKCIVLDMDDTLYGGTVSEDGVDGIVCGGIGAGEAFLDFQKWLLTLSSSGILLAVCSKNDLALAESVFDCSSMALKRSDFVAFYANWRNKCENIVDIAKQLNISTDSILYVDDQAFERNAVRNILPEVIVPELPELPEERLIYLQGLCLFKSPYTSSEDIRRKDMLIEEEQRKVLQHKFKDFETYLKSLNMEITVESLSESNVGRMSQLALRSNRFNLRTVRYSENQLKKIHSDGNLIFSFELSDNIGGYGIIGGIVLLKTNEKSYFIDNLFMSCRVLKRGVEDFMMNFIVEYLQNLKVEELHAEYIPTQKNKMMKDFLENYDFLKRENKFLLQLENYKPRPNYISLRRKNN